MDLTLRSNPDYERLFRRLRSEYLALQMNVVELQAQHENELGAVVKQIATLKHLYAELQMRHLTLIQILAPKANQ